MTEKNNRGQLFVRQGGQKKAERALPPMAGGAPDIVVTPISETVVVNTTSIPATGDIFAGVAVTGWLEIEKDIFHVPTGNEYFLEKKLPFQLVILGFPA